MPRQRKRGIKGAGSVYQRKSDGRWVGSFMVEETGKRKDIYADSEKEAWQKLQQAQMEQKQGILATGPQQKLSTFLEEWFENAYKHKIRQSSYIRYRGLLDNHILPALGHFQVQKLTTQRIQTLYTEKLKEGQSSSSVHNMNTLLNSALEYAVQRRLIGINPCRGIMLPPKEAGRKQGTPLTIEQARHLLQVVQGHRLEPLIFLALSSGMRKGELLALRWEDVNLAGGVVNVHRTVNRVGHWKFFENEPKTKSSRRVILIPPEVCAVLQRHYNTQQEARAKAGDAWKDLGLVFCNRNGGFIRPDILLNQFHALLEQAQLPKLRLHDLRHSAATIMAEFRVSPKVVQQMLGHSSLDITMNLYTHVLPSMQKEAVEKIQPLFQKPLQE